MENRKEKKSREQLLKVLQAFKCRNELLNEELIKNNEEIKKLEFELSILRDSKNESKQFEMV